MALTPRERAVLRALCDTFAPPGGAADDPAGEPLLARVESLVGEVAPEDQARLRLLLHVLATPVLGGALSGQLASFPRMSPDARARVLRDWGSSRIQLRRAGFQALKRLINVSHYAWPAAGGTHSAWREVGYPGPLPPTGQPDRELPTLTVTADTTLECDVVIVGSGAGGGVAAGILAAAGRSVIVLEKGTQHTVRDFTQVEGDMLHATYLDHGLIMTRSGSLPLLAGQGLGGGTVINYTTSFPMAPHVRAEWDRLSGLSLFAGPRFTESYERVQRRLCVNTTQSVPGPRDQILEAGCRANGWHCDVIPRNVDGCVGGAECGYCIYGCRHNAKQSTALTYLADAVGNGARLVTGCAVERVLLEGGRAAGVEALVTAPDGRRVRLTVRAKQVVASAGALYTPVLLQRSGLGNPNIGRGLRLHPGTALLGVFDERVEPWSGAMQTRYSDQFSDRGDGYGVKFETVPVHFAMPASAFGWESAEQHRADMHNLANMSLWGLLLRDRDPGRVSATRSGHARVDYEISAHSVANLRAAFRGAAQGLAAAGARQIMSVQQPPVRVRPGAAGWLDDFQARMDRVGYDRCRMAAISFHQMASCAMGRDPARSVVNEMGESHDVSGLFVADGSAFVTSSGVNPMITIMAIADHVARGMVGA